MACAIDGPSGKAIAALSIAGPAQRLAEESLRGELATAAQEAAREIGRRLGAARRETAE